jgi:hypothetical protein
VPVAGTSPTSLIVGDLGLGLLVIRNQGRLLSFVSNYKCNTCLCKKKKEMKQGKKGKSSSLNIPPPAP